ncbi:MAG TPA: sugar ABC transporter ATP-binding protein [Gaiellaceae bacterium]|jgi:ribose transport system ATP-binding protein|nr:sugar ABC transporter ATP-binding protein [Gaiellaceae bacterium]
MTDSVPLLEARDIAKSYGAVQALRSADLVVEPGEVHALLGANGAGKSTLVKVLTGVISPDRGAVAINGRPVRIGSPARAARNGLAPVFQDPALVPDLTIAQNMRLTGASPAAVERELRALDLAVDFSELARDVPLPMLRMIDLARALAREPQLLLLDEITAALPSDLAERVFTVMRASRERGRSVLFITHRLKEVIASCDRATILRDGGAVATIVPEQGGEETIVEYMLGPEAAQAAVAAVDKDVGDVGARPVATGVNQALEVIDVSIGRVRGVSFSLRPGEILGVAALEGQGQDDLFAVLSGQQSPATGEVRAGGKTLKARHPYDAIRAGVVLVPADRLQALLPQRSVRENIAAPRYNSLRRWGPINMRDEGRRVREAEEALQIDTRAARQVRRLSGGNQQKVTIARWLANGFATMLCFDPTRGIDVGTKRQIYALLRRLADDGAAILFFSSELAEFPLVCDRVLTLFGGEVTAELAGAAADEASLLRAMHGLAAEAEAVA